MNILLLVSFNMCFGCSKQPSHRDDSSIHNICIGGELCGFRGLKNGEFLSKLLDSGKTFFAVSVYTDQIGMGFEADTLENET